MKADLDERGQFFSPVFIHQKPVPSMPERTVVGWLSSYEINFPPLHNVAIELINARTRSSLLRGR